MANTTWKDLKFNLNNFWALGAPDLIINIWSYNNEPVHHPACIACKTYCEYSIYALWENWEEEWGDFGFAVEKFRSCEKSFLDVGAFSSANMHLIIAFLKKAQ